MSSSRGITQKHSRSCPRTGKCDCPWQAQVWDAKAERRISRTFPNVTGAKRFRQDAYAELRAGKLSADRGEVFKDAAEEWLDALRAGHITNRSGDVYKPAAVRDYERNLRLRAYPKLGHLRVGEVTTQDVQRLVDELVRADLAAATIDAAVTPLKAFFRRAVARGEARVNPTSGIEKPAVRTKPKRIVDAATAERMIAALDPEERALWATAFYAGLRRGELIGLRQGDLDLAGGVLSVERGWDLVEGGEVAPKSRQGKRRVPIVPVLRDYLDARILDGEHGQLFGSPTWVSRAGRRAAKRWEERGLPVLTMHECRHTFASFAIAAGLNAKTLSTYMGHATIAITLDQYGHLLPGNEDESADLLHAFLSRTGAATAAQTAAHPEKVPA
jgi:integrase